MSVNVVLENLKDKMKYKKIPHHRHGFKTNREKYEEFCLPTKISHLDILLTKITLRQA
jgi:hypothetical protein